MDYFLASANRCRLYLRVPLRKVSIALKEAVHLRSKVRLQDEWMDKKQCTMDRLVNVKGTKRMWRNFLFLPSFDIARRLGVDIAVGLARLSGFGLW